MTLISKILNFGSNKLYEKGTERKNSSFLENQLVLVLELESPPLTLYGPPNESSGSILSGVLRLEPTQCLTGGNNLSPMNSLSSYVNVELESMSLKLMQYTKYTSPFLVSSSSIVSCKDCSVNKVELAKWDIITTRTTFNGREFTYPFSHLLPGSLPPSSKLGSKNSNSFIKYEIIARAKPVNGEELVTEFPLNISRLIIGEHNKNYVRLFPPTEVISKAVLPNVVHPRSTFPLFLTLESIVNDEGNRHWRMKKFTWKLQEHVKVRANACPRHQKKLKEVEQTYGKNISRRNNNNLGQLDAIRASQFDNSTIHTEVSFSPPSSRISGGNNRLSTGERNRESEQDEYGPRTETHEAQVHRSSLPSASHESISMAGQRYDYERIARPHPSRQGSDINENISQGDQDCHIFIDEIRTVAYNELKKGWKTDYLGKGKIDLMTEINVLNLSSGSKTRIDKRTSEDPRLTETRNANFACDIDDPTLGIHVKHCLILEMQMEEEAIYLEKRDNISKYSAFLSPVTSAKSQTSHKDDLRSDQNINATPTGIMRVLRMLVNIMVAERSGLGISWDDEVPPTYENVRYSSPPNYNEVTDLQSLQLSPFQSNVSSLCDPSHYVDGVGGSPVPISTSQLGSVSTNFQHISGLDQQLLDLRI